MDALCKYPWCGAVVLGLGGTCLLGFLASAPVPKRHSKERAKKVAERLLQSCKENYTFDQLLQGLELHEVKAEGKVCSSVVVSGAMLSKEQTLHEGALMCLVDDLTSLAVWLRAPWPGVSVEMQCTALAPVPAGVRLFAEATVKRLGSTLAVSSFELRKGEGGELLAVGGQTKHVGLPFMRRALIGLGLQLPLLGEWLSDRSEVKSRSLLESWVRTGKHPPLQKLQGPLEGALGLAPLGPETIPKTFGFFSHLHLLNGYWGGHGASSAGLLAEAVREHLRAEGLERIFIASIRCSYMLPVPAFQGLAVILTPLPKPHLGIARHFFAEIRNEAQLFVQGDIVAMPA